MAAGWADGVASLQQAHPPPDACWYLQRHQAQRVCNGNEKGVEQLVAMLLLLVTDPGDEARAEQIDAGELPDSAWAATKGAPVSIQPYSTANAQSVQAYRNPSQSCHQLQQSA